MHAPAAAPAHVPPAAVRIVFDRSTLPRLHNPYFGLEEVEVLARLWNRGFEASYRDGLPRVAPVHLGGHRKAEWLKGYDTGQDARETVEWEAERDRLAHYDATVTHFPWGDDLPDAAELAEARVAVPETWVVD